MSAVSVLSASPAPRVATSAERLDAVAAIARRFGASHEHKVDEVTLRVGRAQLVPLLAALRDEGAYQQLMEIAGVDYPARPERFEVVYHLLSVTLNHRVRVSVATDEATPVDSVTGLWPNAGWLEREVFDLYGVTFAGNADLRRILTDYGFEGHPFRKDFPLTGHVEMRWSEEAGRVVYEPVRLAQDLRQFDFLSPWEGADYVLPGDEKAGGTGEAPGKGAQTTQTAAEVTRASNDPVKASPPPSPKTTDKPVVDAAANAPVPSPTGLPPARKTD